MGLDDHCLVTFRAHRGQGIFDGGADPRASGLALALEGEEPLGVIESGLFGD